MTEFKYRDRTFKAGKINAFDQMDVMILLGPMFAALPASFKRVDLTALESLDDLKGFADRLEKDKNDGKSVAKVLEFLQDGLPAISKALKEVDRNDREEAIKMLLRGVKLANPRGETDIVSSNGALKFDDWMTADVIIYLAAMSFWENLSDFFPLIPSKFIDSIKMRWKEYHSSKTKKGADGSLGPSKMVSANTAT